jgi:hypothetical protein
MRIYLWRRVLVIPKITITTMGCQYKIYNPGKSGKDLKGRISIEGLNQLVERVGGIIARVWSMNLWVVKNKGGVTQEPQPQKKWKG